MIAKPQYRKCKINPYRQARLIDFFIAGVPAKTSSDLYNIPYKTVWRFNHRLRHIIAWELQQAYTPPYTGVFEIDESYFGGAKKGKRGRGAGGKTAVLGILERGGPVYFKVVKDTKGKTLIPIISNHIQAGSTIYTDGYKVYEQIPDQYYHDVVRHKKGEYVKLGLWGELVHTNGIENAWKQAKRHIKKHNGISSQFIELYLKESEWHFNNPSYHSKKTQLKQWIKRYLKKS